MNALCDARSEMGAAAPAALFTLPLLLLPMLLPSSMLLLDWDAVGSARNTMYAASSMPRLALLPRAMLSNVPARLCYCLMQSWWYPVILQCIALLKAVQQFSGAVDGQTYRCECCQTQKSAVGAQAGICGQLHLALRS